MNTLVMILSPAKKMRVDTDSFAVRDLPQFLDKAETLLASLRAMEPRALQALWKCNDQIAALNVERLTDMDLRRNLTPALLSYDGIAYRYLAPNVMTGEQLDYVAAHLRILSGFYGVLRPFDGVTPYRLEMGARLSAGGCRDLYQFWGGALAGSLCGESSCIVNLASKEYSRAVEPHLPPDVRFVTAVFGEHIGGKTVEKGTMCKMARGEMVRWMAERRVEQPEQMRDFDQLGYRFCSEESDETTYTFIKEE
ncbi:MAG: peroxide stress protein YaaA [Oscillospiraceae bacterium]|nr:peroxide stress protein YaaA [Oscillospiraceae bacterium]